MIVSAKLRRFLPYDALYLFWKLVDSTRTIYNIPTAIYSLMEMATYYFGFTCYFLAVCLVGAGYQLSACYLPIPRRLPAVCLFVWSLTFCLYRYSSLQPQIEQDINSLPFRTLTFALHKSYIL